MLLTELLKEADLKEVTVLDDVSIAGLTADSRLVKPGYLFAAIPGTALDGRDFIEDAICAGAVAILAPADVSARRIPDNVSVLSTDNPRLSLARIAAAFYNSKPNTIVAVTGTNGKTSVTAFT